MIATARVHPAEAFSIFTGKHANLEARGGKRVEVGQLLHVAKADLATGLVSFPDQARVAGFGEALRRVAERRVPAPAVRAGDADALVEQEKRRRAAGLPLSMVGWK